MSDLKTWLADHPNWILRSDLSQSVKSDFDLNEILRNNEFAYITHDGKCFQRLRDVPTFIGIRQVIKYSTSESQI